MNVSIDDLSPVKKKITIVVPPEAANEEVDKEFREISRQVKIKGFRPGKAPRAHLEKLFGDEVRGRAMLNVVNNAFQKALTDNEFEVVGEPEIEAEEIKPGEEYTFSAAIEIKPHFEPVGYSDLKLTRKVKPVDEAVVDEELERIRQRASTVEPLAEPRPIAKGDVVYVDFKAYDDGIPIEGVIAENDMLYVEDGASRLPGFVDQLVGANKDDELDIKLNIPGDFADERLAGKNILLVTKIREHKIRVIPELDDDLASSLGEYQTLDDLKKNIREQVKMIGDREAEREMREQIMDKLREANPISLPAGMVDAFAEDIRHQTESRMKQYGIDPDSAEGPDAEQESQYQDGARKQVHWLLVVDRIAKKENIGADAKEVELRYRELASMTGLPISRLKEFRHEGEVVSELITEKVFRHIIDASEVTDESVEEEKKKGKKK